MPGYLHPTPTQRRVLAYVTEAIRARGRPPTYQEITDHFRWKSTNAARGHVRLLIRKGLLRKDNGLARGVGLPEPPPPPAAVRELPVIGQVTAGLPVEAIQQWEGAVAVDAALFPESDLFGLRVKGDSMVGAGIHNGDIAVVRRERAPRDGDIVVAVVDGEATTKRFFRHADHVLLRAENPVFPDLRVRPGAELRIAGVVVGLVRRWG